MKVEFNYKGVEVTIRQTFGYGYSFRYADEPYSAQYTTEEFARTAAKQIIDRLQIKKEYLQ